MHKATIFYHFRQSQVCESEQERVESEQERVESEQERVQSEQERIESKQGRFVGNSASVQDAANSLQGGCEQSVDAVSSSRLIRII